MSQLLDETSWPSIRFEEAELPQSLMGISILIDIDDFTEKTGDWIWKLAHCRDVRKSGSAAWCRRASVEISDYLTGNRPQVTQMIRERLGEEGFDPQLTFMEWMESLMKIHAVASAKDGLCSWIADVPGGG